MKRLIPLIICLCLAMLTGCKKPESTATTTTTSPSPADSTSPEYRIAVIPKGTTHEYWKRVHAGAMKAAQELGNVEIIFRGPQREDDREQQIKLMENFIGAGVDAIVLAPLDDQALVGSVKQATQAGIKVVIFDSGIKAEAGKDFATYVATDNFKGGKIGGEYIADQLPEGGRVLLLRYQEGSDSTVQREKGFIEALKANDKIELVDPKRFAGPTRGTAQKAAENLLMIDTNYDAIYTPNESSTLGMLLAIRNFDLAGKVKFIGFDSSPVLLEAMQKGELNAVSVQNPLAMGYLGVKSAIDAINGKELEPYIDTGVVLITADNMDDPQYKDIVSPDYEQYLQD